MMSKIPIRASRLALVVAGMPWSWAAGMKCVPNRPLVDHPQIQKDATRHQNVRLRRNSRRIRITIRAGGSVLGAGGATGASTSAPYAVVPASAGLSRSTSHTSGTRRSAQTHTSPAAHLADGPGWRWSAGSVGEVGDGLQEHQLSRGAGGREHPDHD